jgi:hypothetical protein
MNMKEILTVQPNVAFCIANRIFGDTFIASKIGFAEISNGETHLYTVVRTVDFCHVVLVIGDYHLTCNKNIKGDSKFTHRAISMLSTSPEKKQYFSRERFWHYTQVFLVTLFTHSFSPPIPCFSSALLFITL